MVQIPGADLSKIPENEANLAFFPFLTPGPGPWAGPGQALSRAPRAGYRAILGLFKGFSALLGAPGSPGRSSWEMAI